MAFSAGAEKSGRVTWIPCLAISTHPVSRRGKLVLIGTLEEGQVSRFDPCAVAAGAAGPGTIDTAYVDSGLIDLSTVGQDATATAQHAFKQVASRLEDNNAAGNHGLVTPYFVVRNTTAECDSGQA